MRADKVLALSLDKCDEKKDDDVPADIRDIAERRFAARKAKNWAESDALRAELAEKGWTALDSKDGYTLKKIQ